MMEVKHSVQEFSPEIIIIFITTYRQTTDIQNDCLMVRQGYGIISSA
jgi:hypothetical protein